MKKSNFESEKQCRTDSFGLKGNMTAGWVFALVGVVFCFSQQTLEAQDPFALPRLMDQNPKFVQLEPKDALSDKLLPLWIAALDSKNVNLQRKVAESVVIAKMRGLGPLDSMQPVLLRIIEESELNSNVRIAIAKAVVALDLKDASAAFLELVKSNGDIRLNAVLQPALASWKHEKAGAHWREVLKSNSSRPRQRVWAIEGLAKLGDKTMLPELKKWVVDAAVDYRVRTAAARSLGQLLDNGLIETATRMQKSTSVTERVLAAEMLRQPKESQATALALELAKDADSVVCTIAWNSLVSSSNARQLDQSVEFGKSHREPKVRLAATELLKLWASEKASQQLGVMLSDLHPEVRNNARKILMEFSKEEKLRPSVIDAARGRLDSNWQGIQQALLILTELDHKASAMKMVKLLDHRRGEVHITAGWALEQLSVPETIVPAFQFAEKRVTKIKSGGSADFAESDYECLSHVIQFLGKSKFRDMEKVIIPRLIPKDMSIFAYPIRPAAIWSIGKIYEGKPLPAELKSKLVARLMDDDPNNPEHTYVKSMCAFVFAVTNSGDTIPNIEKYAENTSDNSRFGFYCDWALHQLDGRPIPKVKPFVRNDIEWFLIRLNDSDAAKQKLRISTEPFWPR